MEPEKDRPKLQDFECSGISVYVAMLAVGVLLSFLSQLVANVAEWLTRP